MEITYKETIRDGSLIGKVYGLLTISVVFAIIGNIIGLSHLQSIISHKWLFLIGEFVLTVILSFIGNSKELQFLSFALLNAFTFLSGFTLAPLIAYALKINPAIVVYALSTTAATFILMSVIGFVFKDKVLGIGTFLFVGITALAVGGLLNLFFHSGVVALVITVLSVIIFSLYVSYNTAHMIEADPSMSPVGLTLQLYLDILNIFVNILQLFLSFNRNDE